MGARKFPTELKHLKYEIEEYAREFGLDFFKTIFEVLDFRQLNEIASYGGFPTRYPHWRFGMEHEKLQKGYAYGLQKIYEQVINNDPCYAYLLETNNIVDQKMVMAHVYGHCDFFKNNSWFSKTNRKMMDEMANHGMRIRRYMEKYGETEVDSFIDACLSLENLIDPHSQFIVRRNQRPQYDSAENEKEKQEETVKRLKSKDYMDSFVNPKEFIEAQKERLEEKRKKRKKFPEDPEKDILFFLIEYSPLESWQKDILSIIREESYYFTPQGQTKIMNEGWATYWHSKIMTQKCLKNHEIIDYADHHSGTLGSRPGVINPYKIGLELFRDIEDRWNKGKFGKEYEECDDFVKKKNWNRNLGLGREKIFEIRKIYNDINFIDTFLTKEFCEEQRLFTYEYNDKTKRYEISDRGFKKIKGKFLFSLTNFGQPHIYVEDGNHENRGELYLTHKHEGIDLKTGYAKDTMVNIHKIWKRPVHLQTKKGEKNLLLTYNGKEHLEKSI